jgi:flagellar basal-body rod protein FlgF
MDRMIYVAMTGAKHTLARQENIAQNLSNASTNGFRSVVNAFRSVPVQGGGTPTRTFVVDSTAGANLTQGSITHTGADLDIALRGEGWIAVQLADGSEAYTRDGSLTTSPDGILQTRAGLAVAGESGPITLPPGNKIVIADDGTVTATPEGGQQAAGTIIGRIRLVNPPVADMSRGADGLFRYGGQDQPPPADASVKVAAGALESSNVNVTESMVDMIEQARQYDLQIKALQTAEDDAKQASSLLTLA